MTCGYVVLAHKDPQHLERLIGALAPSPVFVHIDARVTGTAYSSLRAASREAEHLPRSATGWAGWGLVEAELTGLLDLIDNTDVSHIGILSGQDFPLRSSTALNSYFQDGVSAVTVKPIPWAMLGDGGGLPRVRYWHTSLRGRKLRSPFPRRFPHRAEPYFAQQWCVLSREAASAVLQADRDRADIRRFYRHTWIPDEGYLPTLLMYTGPPGKLISENLWFVRWQSPMPHPAILADEDLPELLSAANGPSTVGGPAPCKLFARKFETPHSARLVDALSASLNIA